MDLKYTPLHILHYAKIETVDDTVISIVDNPLVVIAQADAYDKKHLQTRVLPFDNQNTDKEALTFAERLQYYKKTIRNNLRKPRTKESIAGNAAIATLVSNYFDVSDGFDDEFGEFMDGWNTKPVTGYENDLVGFFGEHYLNLGSVEYLNDLKTGMGISLV